MIVRKDYNAPEEKVEVSDSATIFYYANYNVVFYGTWENMEESCSFTNSGSIQCHIKCLKFLPITNDKSTVVMPSLRKKNGKYTDWDYYVNRSVYRNLQYLQEEWKEKYEKEEEQVLQKIQKARKVENAFDGLELDA